MAESSEEKTEQATPKRIREARKKGQVPKSKDLTTVFEMIVVFVTIAVAMDYMADEAKRYMEYVFKVLNHDPDPSELWEVGRRSLEVMIKMTVPALLAGFIAALVIGFLQVGPIFTTETLAPKFEKLNPIEGLKNMFKIVTLIELLKNVAKLFLVFYLAYSTLQKYRQDILFASMVGMSDAMAVTGQILSSFFIKVAVLFMCIALIDLAVQRWNFMKNMRMSKDEVKREYKQDEGDPHVKGERRRLHREMVFGDARKNVKKSDAVVTNPIHVAVAIQYDKDNMAAPEVLVKGQRSYAEMIIQIAKEEGIPIVRNIPLAWSLLALDEGDAIPEELYEPVAEVLSYVYEMKEREKALKSGLALQGTHQAGSPSSSQPPAPGPGGFDPF